MCPSNTDHPHRPRWDGSRPDPRPRNHRALRLHPDNRTHLLRAAQRKPCAHCGNPVEWYYRPDGRPLPLHPREAPDTAVPHDLRWQVTAGIALPGTDRTGWSRIAHPALCPTTAPHPGPTTPELDQLRRTLAVRTRHLIETGRLRPADPAAAPTATPAPRPAAVRRDVVQILHILYLAPGPAPQVRCVAFTSHRRRCGNTLADHAWDTGLWTLLPVPTARRTGELTEHLAGAPMAVYDLTGLPYTCQLRWRTQHCTVHAGTAAPDIALTAWEPFDPFAHHRHITPVLPQPPAEPPAGQQERC